MLELCQSSFFHYFYETFISIKNKIKKSKICGHGVISGDICILVKKWGNIGKYMYADSLVGADLVSSVTYMYMYMNNVHCTCIILRAFTNIVNKQRGKRLWNKMLPVDWLLLVKLRLCTMYIRILQGISKFN